MKPYKKITGFTQKPNCQQISVSLAILLQIAGFFAIILEHLSVSLIITAILLFLPLWGVTVIAYFICANADPTAAAVIAQHNDPN